VTRDDVNNNNNNKNNNYTHTQESAKVKNKRDNAGTRTKGTINNKNSAAATMYPLGTWFVSRIFVWIPCIKEKIIIIIIITNKYLTGE